MEDKILIVKGVGSLSPNYYKSPEFSNKIITLKSEKEPYEVDKILEENIETNILIYEDRVKGWFLDFAEKLTKEKNSEFIVLMICVNYLEGNQQFREGRVSQGESTEMLERALKRIFPTTEESILKYFIDKIRHGLFHDGMTRKGALLRYGLSVPFFTFNIDGEEWITVDPSLFLKEIKKDFESYIPILKNKDNEKERENFDKYYNEKYG
ncbi:hypothetical protein KAI04_00020 [Candidatus Pacearchaeota archaeon]|nr:hypothetical protein [Candidatus Pacearchaeota archaeon]